VARCEQAEAGGELLLDLSNCQLMQVPDAIYFMMRNTPLIACDLSSNVITKIPSKLPTKFSFIKNLNLSQNRMSTLPDELTELTQLESVDISHNSFISLPACLFNAKKLAKINARKNFIADVDIELMLTAPRLQDLNLEENPLSRSCEAKVNQVNLNRIKITYTARELEEWEDLSI
jgi:Leucine-rich repeat (LRR) protein